MKRFRWQEVIFGMPAVGPMLWVTQTRENCDSDAHWAHYVIRSSIDTHEGTRSSEDEDDVTRNVPYGHYYTDRIR